MGSSIPHGSTGPTSGGRVCQPGLSVANFFANCRKRLTEQNFPSPLAWAFGSGIIRPETNAPHWVQRAGFGQTFVASAQKVMFHGGVLREFGVVARLHGILLLSVRNSGVKVAHASTDASLASTARAMPSMPASRKASARHLEDQLERMQRQSAASLCASLGGAPTPTSREGEG